MKTIIRYASAIGLGAAFLIGPVSAHAADSCNVSNVWSQQPWGSKFKGALKNSKSHQYPAAETGACISGKNLNDAKKRVKGYFQPSSGGRAIFKIDNTTYRGYKTRNELRSKDGYDRVRGKAKLYTSASGSKVYTIGQLFSDKSKQPVVRIEVRDNKVWPVIQYSAGSKAKRDTKFRAPSRSSKAGNYFEINMSSDAKSVYVKIGGTSKTYKLSGYTGGKEYVKAGVYANGGSGGVSTNFEYIYFGN